MMSNRSTDTNGDRIHETATSTQRRCSKVRELLELEIELFTAFMRGFDTVGAPVPGFDIAHYRSLNNQLCDQKNLRATHEAQCAECIADASAPIESPAEVR